MSNIFQSQSENNSMSKHKSSSSFTPFIDPRLLQISPSSGSSLNNMGKDGLLKDCLIVSQFMGDAYFKKKSNNQTAAVLNLQLDLGKKDASQTRWEPTRPVKDLWSTSTQSTRAHPATLQRSANTRRGSTLRSCVQHCGVGVFLQLDPGEFDPNRLVDFILCFCFRSEFAGGDGERADVTGQERPGESLPPHQPAPYPADGRPGGTQCSGHHIRCSPLKFFAVQKNL